MGGGVFVAAHDVVGGGEDDSFDIALDSQHENIESVIHAPRALAPRGIRIGIYRGEVNQGIGIEHRIFQDFVSIDVLDVSEVAGDEDGFWMGQRFGSFCVCQVVAVATVGEVGEGGMFQEDDACFSRRGGIFEEVAAELGAEVAKASGDNDGASCAAAGGSAHCRRRWVVAVLIATAMKYF